jgi:HprK-related kinase A
LVVNELADRDQLLSLLETRGVQIAVGPFLVRVQSPLRGVRDYLQNLYPDFPMRDDDAAHFSLTVDGGGVLRQWVRPQARLVVNGAQPFLPLPASLAGPLIEWGLNWCIGNQAHRWVAVHAGVIERNGRVLILSAPPGFGKSTLCAALVCTGWRLFSDEFALVDADTGHVLPVPRPVSLKEASIRIIKQRNPAAVFGPEARDVEGARFVHMRPPGDSVRRARDGAPPGWMIIPRYAADARTTLEPLSKAHALVHLADQSFNYNYLGAQGYTCLAELVSQADCWTLEYSDLDDVVARLTELTAA